jgi:hypothetical protein
MLREFLIAALQENLGLLLQVLSLNNMEHPPHPTPSTHHAQNWNETFPEHWIGWGRLMIGLPIHRTSCLRIFVVDFSDSVNCSEWRMKWRSSLIYQYLINVWYFVFLSTLIHFFQSTSKVVFLSSCIHFDLLYVGMNTMLMIYRFWMKCQVAPFVLQDSVKVIDKVSTHARKAYRAW